LKANEQRFPLDLLYANLMHNNASEIQTLLEQTNKVKAALSKGKPKKQAKLYLSILNEKISHH
jgi:hypothetical protein